ncbi:high mobility group protein HMGI-C-like [Pecten maximus]|uniref:high mobility group protein HMGI-C-like n=1 Tax=Pecten maximus TaxID=6579 RepID=UPI001457FF33|nr:high mobility group protein HMGI-C-like [Pecten maximus]
MSEAATASEVAAENTPASQPTKRGRGRPRKPKPDQPEEPKPKRPRGRPPGTTKTHGSKKEYKPSKPRGKPTKGGTRAEPSEEPNPN